MKLTKNVFLDLAIFMMSFGLIVGLLFPVYSIVIGIPREHINAPFVLSSILAGLVVGLVNISITRFIVGRRIKKLSDSMKYVNQNLTDHESINHESCLQDCLLDVDTTDEISQAGASFNSLVQSFLDILGSEQSIREFTDIFTNELDLKKLSEKALKHLTNYTQSNAGLVLIDKGGLIEVVASYLIKDPELLITNELVQKVFEENNQMVFDFNDDIVVEAGLIDFKPKSILFEPISYKSSVLGVIVLASTKPFDTSITSQLSVYTHGLSLGMHNAITHDKLEQLAILDPLTKIYNRRFGMARLKEEFGKSIRNEKPIGVLMLDIDHFKNVNDTYGHIVGDQVLIQIANIIKQNIRETDVLIRYGGEEFLVILPSAPLAGIRIVAEKVRRYVEEHTLHHNNQDIKVTISIGGASYPEKDVAEIEELVALADQHLYEAKETGRNKHVIQ